MAALCLAAGGAVFILAGVLLIERGRSSAVALGGVLFALTGVAAVIIAIVSRF